MIVVSRESSSLENVSWCYCRLSSTRISPVPVAKGSSALPIKVPGRWMRAPPMSIGNDFIAMTKDSSLVYVVGVQELLWRAQAAGRPSGQSFTTLIIAAIMYWCLTLILSYFQARLEKRMAAGDRNR